MIKIDHERGFPMKMILDRPSPGLHLALDWWERPVNPLKTIGAVFTGPAAPLLKTIDLLRFTMVQPADPGMAYLIDN